MELFYHDNFTFFFDKDLNGWKLNGAVKIRAGMDRGTTLYYPRYPGWTIWLLLGIIACNPLGGFHPPHYTVAA